MDNTEAIIENIENIDNTQEISTEPDFKALYIQTLADYLNLQKRSDKILKDSIQRAKDETLIHFLQIYQDVKTALKFNKDDEGFNLIYSKFIKLLNEFEVEVIDKEYIKEKLNNKFSSDYMYAVTSMPSEKDVEHNSIADVITDGLIHKSGRVISYANVIVYTTK